jgi:LysM repeat protein
MSGESSYFYHHEIQKGQSLYALSRIFNVSISRLYEINNLDTEAIIDIGQQIKVPINDDYLYKGVSLVGLKFGHYIPVYYKTKPKDNLFRISRVYFHQPIENLSKRNNLVDNNLALGQDILIGWLPIGSATPVENEDEFVENFDDPESLPDLTNPVSPSTIDLNLEIAESVSTETKSDSFMHVDMAPEGFNLSLLGSLTYSKYMKEIKRSEVANWDNTMPDNGMVYVLHKDAILDSFIDLYNPLVRRSVRAKVIGRIPYGAYTNDVSLVLSPHTAKQLGALDNRFKVEVKALVYDKK